MKLKLLPAHATVPRAANAAVAGAAGAVGSPWRGGGAGDAVRAGRAELPLRGARVRPKGAGRRRGAGPDRCPGPDGRRAPGGEGQPLGHAYGVALAGPELQRAIDEHLWDPAARSYGGGVEYCAYPLWPVELAPADRSRLADHAEYCWRELEPTFRAPASDPTFGLYESKALIALARFWRRGDPAKLARVRRGIAWIAHVEATPDTHVLGETWRVARGRVLTCTATPHLWEHTLFYLAMLETYGAER